MIVGESKTPEMDRMFASLVPGFPIPPPAAVPPDLGYGGITCLEPSPVLPPHTAEKTPPDDLSSYLLRSFLDFMVTQVCSICILHQQATHHLYANSLSQNGVCRYLTVTIEKVISS